MVVSARPVDVPMCQLIFRGTTDFRNFDIKRQIHPRQRVIPVQCYVGVAHLRGGDNGRVGILPRTKSVTHLDTFCGHLVQWHFHNVARVVFAICVLGLDRHVFLIADLHPPQLRLKPGNDLPGLLQKRQRFPACRRVQRLSRVIGQRIVKRNDVFAHAQPFL